jgi:2-polyprenyl-3-methyl-5-hydroxy-6-metoxy-1,4-benzoquinol methylase
MTLPSDREARQEAQYELPYHHVPRLRDGVFTQDLIIPWGYTYLACLGFLVDLLEKRNFHSLLDVGCGDGRFLSEVSQRFPDAALAGVDTSERAVAMARAFCPQARFACGTLADALADNDTFDVISLQEVLEHVPPDECDALLLGMRERLSPGGILLLTVPSDNVPVSAKHYRHFDAESLAQTLGPAFEIEQLHYLAKRSPWNRLVRWALWNRLYAITSRTVAHRAFTSYRRRLLHAQPRTAGRLCAICRASGDARKV